MLRKLGLSKEELPLYNEHNHSFANLDENFNTEPYNLDNDTQSDDSSYHSDTDYSYTTESESENEFESESEAMTDEFNSNDDTDQVSIISLSSDESIYTGQGVETSFNTIDNDDLEITTNTIVSLDETKSTNNHNSGEDADWNSASSFLIKLFEFFLHLETSKNCFFKNLKSL